MKHVPRHVMWQKTWCNLALYLILLCGSIVVSIEIIRQFFDICMTQPDVS